MLRRHKVTLFHFPTAAAETPHHCSKKERELWRCVEEELMMVVMMMIKITAEWESRYGRRSSLSRD